jgi:radical SAM protein with 4Fe4S-binding SPASM domain
MLVSRAARKLIGGYIYSIKLEVNDYCNLRCKMCYVDKLKQDLSDKHIYKLLDSMKGQGIRLEILGGEPLMREDILDIIHYAKEKCRIPFISLYTNGTGANMEMASNLKKAGLDAILVTLISHRENVHDEFTGIPGSWKKTTAGIRELVKAGIETYSFTTVHRYNHEHCRAIYRFVKQELKAHSLFYQYIPQQKEDPLLISASDWHQIKHWILLEENVAHAGFVRDFYTISGNACSGGNFVLTVKVDGSVQPCPFIHNIPLGNIKKDSIWSIYRKRFSMPELVEFKSTPKECLACAYKSICGGGCKAGNDVYSGTYSCKDLRCLGPFAEVQSKEKVMADLPTFF